MKPTKEEIEKIIKDNAGISLGNLAKMLGVNSMSLGVKLGAFPNIYCEGRDRLFYHEWEKTEKK